MFAILAMFVWWNAAQAFYSGDIEKAFFLLGSALLCALITIAFKDLNVKVKND